MPRLSVFFFLLISLSAYSSIHMIDERELSFEEREQLGFLKVPSPKDAAAGEPVTMLFTFPEVFEKDFQIRDVFFEGFEGEQIIFKTSIKLEDSENEKLKEAFVQILASSNTTYKVSFLYSRVNTKNSIEVSRLITLGNIDLINSTSYIQYLDWGKSL